MRSRKRVDEQEAYRRYRRDYKLRERRMKRRHEKMDTPMLSEEDFDVAYQSYKNDMEDYALNTGRKKPSSQNIIDTIVSDQMYDISIRQARAYKEALDYSVDDWDDQWPGYGEEGERYSLTPTNIRRGIFDEPLENVFDMVRAFRAQKAKDGWTKKQIREEVAHTFFGSP